MMTTDRTGRLYLAYGGVLLALFAAACYRGWTLTSPEEVRGVPKTVRENPGSYRSHYATHSHYFGGK